MAIGINDFHLEWLSFLIDLIAEAALGIQ